MPAEVLTFQAAEGKAAECPVTSYLDLIGYRAANPARSREVVRGSLAALCGTIPESYPWDALTAEIVAGWHRSACESYSPASVRRMFACLRGVLRQCWRMGLISADTRDRLSDLPRIKAETSHDMGRFVTRAEIARLFRECSPRERVMLRMLYNGALRREEAAAVLVGHCNLDTGEVEILAGKGNKPGVAFAFCDPAGLRIIQDWTEGLDPARSLLDRGSAWMYKACIALAKRAGVARFSPHALRHACISHLYDKGISGREVQRIARHTDGRVTEAYDRRNNDAARRSAASLEDL